MPPLAATALYIDLVDLRLVEYFLAVVDHGGITNAAKALYVAQPSVSQAIRQLERQVGVDLFDRTGKRVALNANGAAFVTPARNIVRDVAQAHDRVAGILELRAGRLEIAALSTLSMDPLPGWSSRSHSCTPGSGSPSGIRAARRP